MWFMKGEIAGWTGEMSIVRNSAERRFAMRLWYFVICLFLICSSGCASMKCASEDEKEISLSQVPAKAVQGAQRAVKGITLTEAEVEEDGRTVYELEGTANGKEYEIEVTADGKVLGVEQEADDDDGDNHDDDEDEDEEHDDVEDDD